MKARAWALAAPLVLGGMGAVPVRAVDDPTAHPQVVLKVGGVDAPGSPFGKQLEAFAHHVERRTGGKVRVKLLLGGTLGDEATLVARTRAGTLQAYAGSLAGIAEAAPALEALQGPYLYPNAQRARRALDRGVRGKVERALAEVGLRFTSWGPEEFRVWFTRGARMARPRAVHGTRVPETQRRASAATYAALQMTQVSLESGVRPGEALAGGVIDAFDAPLMEAVAAGDDRAATHVVMSEHALSPRVLVYSARWFAGLPEVVQRKLERIPGTLLRDARAASTAARERVVTHLRARGVQVIEPSSAERAAFTRATQGARQSLAREVGGLGLLRATARR